MVEDKVFFLLFIQLNVIKLYGQSSGVLFFVFEFATAEHTLLHGRCYKIPSAVCTLTITVMSVYKPLIYTFLNLPIMIRKGGVLFLLPLHSKRQYNKLFLTIPVQAINSLINSFLPPGPPYSYKVQRTPCTSPSLYLKLTQSSVTSCHHACRLQWEMGSGNQWKVWGLFKSSG